MDHSALEGSSLFFGVPAGELGALLAETPHRVRRFDRGEAVFRLLEPADRVGVVLEGRVEAQKTFPNGSRVNVSVRGPGEMIGPAAAFSRDRRYPCDVVALEPTAVMMLRRDDILSLMQRDARVLENLTCEIASATYMLQQRLELLSYGGIAQKAAFWLLTQARRTGARTVRIPGSVTKWARLMNVSRPSLHRELAKLEAAGIISYAPPVIGILDAAALQDVLGR